MAHPRHRTVPRWFIVSALLIAAVPAVTIALNLAPIRAALIQRLAMETGIELTDLRIRLLPRVHIQFWNAVIRDAHHTRAIFHAQEGVLTLRLFPLLRKEIALSQATVVAPRVVIRRDREGRWHMPFLDEPEPAVQGSQGFAWGRLIPDLRVLGGTILLEDEFERESLHTLGIENIHIELDADLLRETADLTLNGEVNAAGTASHISLEGELSIAGASEKLDSLDETGAPPPVRFEGTVALTQVNLGPWLDPTVPLTDARWRADVSSRLVLEPGDAGYNVTWSQFEARLDWVTLHGSGLLYGFGGEHPAYSFTVSGSPVDLATLLRHLPAAWIDASIRSAMAEYEVTGTLELVSATMTGALNRPGEGEWKGTVKLSRGGAVVGPARTPIRELAGTVFFDRVHAEAMDLSGQVGPLRVSNGTLIFSHLDVAPAVDLRATGSGRVRDVLELLRAVGRPAAGATTLSAIVDLTGEVQVSLHIGGPLTPTPQVELIRADITVHDLGAKVPNWNLSAEHLDGIVGITPRFIEFKHLQGTVGPIRFDLEGAVEPGSPPRFEDVTMTASIEGSGLRSWLVAHASLPPDVILDGPVYAVMRLSGPVSSPTWRSSIDLSQTTIAVPPVFKKRTGMAASLKFDGMLVKGKRLIIRRLAWELPRAHIEGWASVRLQGRPTFRLHLKAGPLPFAGLVDVVPMGSITEGMVEVSIGATGRGPDWTSWTLSGLVTVERGTIALEDFRDPLRELSLRVYVEGRDVRIERLSFKLGDSDLAVRGFVKRWASDPALTLAVESSKLDFMRLIPHERTEGGRQILERLRWWAASHHAEVTVSIKQAQYHRLVFSTLSGRLRLGGGKIALDQVTGKTPEGVLSGQIVADIHPTKPMEVETALNIDGMPVQRLIAVIDPEAEPLQGTLSLTGTVRGTVDGPSPFLRTLRSLAPLKLRLDWGQVLHGTVLPKVLKMLNVPALLKGKVDFEHDGIPFDTISATITVEDGMLASHDIFFDSPIMKVSGAGTLDMVSDELHLALAVSPLGAYSDLIGKVPLFGRLLAGDRPGLSTALFEVKGPRRNPAVRYLPIESFAKGLTGYPRLALDVLTNAIALPKQLLIPRERE